MKILATPLVLAALLLASPAFAAAETAKPAVPRLIDQGLAAYSQSGLNTALQFWLENSTLDRTTLLRGELAALSHADAHHGRFEDGKALRTTTVAPRVTRVYLILHYERAPLWAWFDVYRTRTGAQVVADVFFSSKADAVLPPDLLGR